jgi:hypothetical protein
MKTVTESMRLRNTIFQNWSGPRPRTMPTASRP